MNAIVVLILGALGIGVGYGVYARNIDKNVVEPDPDKATPARMYMDGVDFAPASRNVLFRVPVQVCCRTGSTYRAYHRRAVGLAAGVGLDHSRSLLHRLGPGLWRYDHGRAS
jgi:hypothetical protein